MEVFTCPQSVDFFTEPESFAPPQDSSDPATDERDPLASGFATSPDRNRAVPIRQRFEPLPLTPLYGFFLVGLMLFLWQSG